MSLVPLNPGGWAPGPEDTPWHRLGGDAGVAALVEAFYDAMEAHEPALTAVHHCEAPGKVSRVTRQRFTLFLQYWLGGPDTYLTERGHPRLRMRHGGFTVDAALRDAWLRSMGRAMDERGVTGPERPWLDARFAQVAEFLRNDG